MAAAKDARTWPDMNLVTQLFVSLQPVARTDGEAVRVGTESTEGRSWALKSAC